MSLQVSPGKLKSESMALWPWMMNSCAHRGCQERLCCRSVTPTKYLPQIRFNGVMKRWKGQTEQGSYTTSTLADNFFTGSGCQLGTNITQCVLNLSLEWWLKMRKPPTYNMRTVSPRGGTSGGDTIQREGFQWQTHCSQENHSKGVSSGGPIL